MLGKALLGEKQKFNNMHMGERPRKTEEFFKTAKATTLSIIFSLRQR